MGQNIQLLVGPVGPNFYPVQETGGNLNGDGDREATNCDLKSEKDLG